MIEILPLLLAAATLSVLVWFALSNATRCPDKLKDHKNRVIMPSSKLA